MKNWRKWANMPDEADDPAVAAVLESKENDPRLYRKAAAKYHLRLQQRIKYLLEQVPTLIDPMERAFGHYVLAELFDRADMLVPRHYLKRGVRYHCIRAVRLNPGLACAWALLANACSWLYMVCQERGDEVKFPRLLEVRDHEERTLQEDVAHADDEDIGPARERVMFQIRWSERAVRYALRALKFDPENKTYRKTLEQYLQMRNWAYADFHT